MAVGTPSPAWARLGLRALGSGEGRAVVEMDCTPDMRNVHHLIHSGFLGGLADAAMALAVDSQLAPGQMRTTFDLKLSIVSPAAVGARLRATARVVHLGRRTAFADGRLEDSQGVLVATATGTFHVTQPEEAGRRAD